MRSNRLTKRLLVMVTMLLPALVAALPNFESPIGYWNTVDDKTGKVLSQTQIYPQPGTPTLSAKVVTIYPVNGQKPTDKCVKCDGALHNKPILGMRIMYGMIQDEDDASKWIHGRVIDPVSGNTYRAKMWLTDGGCRLHLRGFVGISLFGRTEIWQRARTKQCR